MAAELAQCQLLRDASATGAFDWGGGQGFPATEVGEPHFLLRLRYGMALKACLLFAVGGAALFLN